jgi:GST-like protein
VGPIFGQLGFFYKFAGKDIEDKRPLVRFAGETKRLLGVLDTRLQSSEWIMGDEYTIADISMFGWVRAVIEIFDAGTLVGFDALHNVPGWLARVLARPAVARGLTIPG